MEYTVNVDAPRAFYEVPFGVIERPVNGEEEPHLTWVSVKNGANDYGMAIINDSKYSSSVKDDRLSLTAVRSPVYGDHGGPKNAESMFTDQGSHRFVYGIMPVVGDSWAKVIREARVLNVPLTNVIENNHNGTLPLSDSLLSVDCENVLVSAIKRAEDGDGWILRAYETDGKNGKVCISVQGMPQLVWDYTPYSVETFRLPDGGAEWRRVMLTEFDYQ